MTTTTWLIVIMALAYFSFYLLLDREKQRQRVKEKLRSELIDRGAYHIGALEMSAYINDFDGNSKLRWVYKDVKKPRYNSPPPRIPGRLRFYTEGSSISKYPTLIREYMERFKLEFITREPNFCEFQVTTNHAVTSNMHKINFEYVAEVKKAFKMTREELEQQSYKEEWFGYVISSAIESLTIKIFFPQSYEPKPKVRANVCIGLTPTELIDTVEFSRINGGFKNDPDNISITIRRPKLGYVYFLCWTPLTTEQVGEMKSMVSGCA
jgi:hypothetical protein